MEIEISRVTLSRLLLLFGVLCIVVILFVIASIFVPIKGTINSQASTFKNYTNLSQIQAENVSIHALDYEICGYPNDLQKLQQDPQSLDPLVLKVKSWISQYDLVVAQYDADLKNVAPNESSALYQQLSQFSLERGCQ